MGGLVLRPFAFSALLAVSGAAIAQEFVHECRAEVRAQLKGAQCKVSILPGTEQVGFIAAGSNPCAVKIGSFEERQFNERTIACMAAGGPKKWLAGKGKR